MTQITNESEIKEKPVLCASCKKPIHIKDFGSVVSKDGEQFWIHDNYVCIMEAKEKGIL